jgi:hypothetical protein
VRFGSHGLCHIARDERPEVADIHLELKGAAKWGEGNGIRSLCLAAAFF